MGKIITEQSILSALNKIYLVEQDIKDVLIDRDNVIKLLILCIIAKENILLLGPPGTAKSMLADELKNRISEAKIFKKLLTEFTEESELFVSERSIITGKTETGETTQKIYKSVRGMLPETDIAFLDEIFKANSAILNAMLTLINEREYHINNQVISSDLITVIGASNERPAPGTGLEALYDRFLVRYWIGYLDDDNLLEMLKENKNKKNKIKISKRELESLNEYLNLIKIPDEILVRISRIKNELKAAKFESIKKLTPSDRRLKNSLKLVKAHALYMRRNIVENADVDAVFPYILWDTASEKTKFLDKDAFFELEKIFNKGAIVDNLETWNKEINDKKKSLNETIKLLQTALRNNSGNLDELYRKYCTEVSSIISKIEQSIESVKDRLNKSSTSGEKNVLRSCLNKWNKLKDELEGNMVEIADEYDKAIVTRRK